MFDYIFVVGLFNFPFFLNRCLDVMYTTGITDETWSRFAAQYLLRIFAEGAVGTINLKHLAPF